MKGRFAMIKIVGDTLSCISLAEAKKLGIGFLPQIIVFGTETFRDDYELTTEEFLKKLRASDTLPKTAAPAPALYEPIFQEFSRDGDTVLVLCPSKEVSGTYRSASVAAKDFPNADIRVIETNTIGTALGDLVKLAVDWVKQGMDADTILQKLEEKSKAVRIYFYVETLEYLHKGGRIGNASKLVGSLLQVKPILRFTDAKIQAFETQRTKRRALDRLAEIVKTECPKNAGSHLAIMESDAFPTAAQLREDFKTSLGIENIDIYTLPPAIVVHTGPGVVAASFFVE